ncbi:sporulation integral membrane protein YlbJ [Clostridium acetireducens DSM 10703]|uniref:Sporulation integral membrane protein YlbJ n=1 Tax=Clostridium acetireducens DSM 10703 TaxID=1121290 RepID=A0A1E8F2V6_9CLOT|nr:sporulation integral membrane protein YlbJ [Clostridium acetireducens]OFI07688.1 sporulation integral membrane protein YlbJ [Clostridium acetireducens DSM 10703]
MIILIFLLCISIFCIIFFLFKKKNILITILFSLSLLYFILNPEICINSTLNGIKIFFNKVFPSLFPFLIISNIIISYDGISIYSKLLGSILCKPLRLPKECSFVLIISALCGYPLGAKYCCDLYEKGIIDFNTTERLLNIASNASPLFIVGAVGTSMLQNPYLGYLLLISNYISCIIMGLILPSKITSTINKNFTNKVSVNKNIGNILKDSIENSIKTCLSIGGFITIFSVLNTIIKNNFLFNTLVNNISLLLNIPKEAIEGFSLGLIEITNGCNIISLNYINTYYKLIIISFLIGFSGISIISQVYSFTYKFNFSIKKYTYRKLIQSFICAFTTMLLYTFGIFNSYIQTLNTSYKSISWLQNLLLILIVLPFILHNIKNLFHIS